MDEQDEKGISKSIKSLCMKNRLVVSMLIAANVFALAKAGDQRWSSPEPKQN